MKEDEIQGDETLEVAEEYITLKEAAKISGYSADYIGQLIRKGKIPGRQVYTNIAWVTTEEAIRTYLSGESTKHATGAQEVAGGDDLNIRTWYEKILVHRGAESSIRLILYTLLIAGILALIFTILTWYGSFSQSILGRPGGTYERSSIALSSDATHYRDSYGR